MVVGCYKKELILRGKRKLLGVMYMFIILILAMVSQLCTYVKLSIYIL